VKILKKFIGPLISLVLIVLIFHKIDFHKVFETFDALSFKYVAIIIPVYYISFVFRALRWRLLLVEKPDCSLIDLMGNLLIGHMVNILAPARAGDVYRAYLLGKNAGISRIKVLASVVVERIMDGSMLFFMLLSFITVYYKKSWAFKLAFMSGFLFIGGFIFLFLISKYGKNVSIREKTNFYSINFPKFMQNTINTTTQKISEFKNTFVTGLESINSISLLIKAMFYTFGIWAFEGAVVFFILQSFGLKLGLASAIFVMCITSFSTMIPSGSVFLGPYQYGYIIALGAFSIAKEPALAVALANQIVIMALVFAAGIIYLLKSHINLKDLREVSR
jgi:uncharacterized protein (TIRG00374 family)